MCPTKLTVAPAGFHRSTAAPPTSSTPLQRRLPAAVLLSQGEWRSPKGEDYPDLRLHTDVHIYDSNNGIRAWLPLCNPNPNRVKAKKRVTGVANITVYRSSPPPCVGGKKPHRSTAHDKSKEPNRSSSDLRKEEEWVRIWPNPKT